jgi:D-hexose-6-phosphate mutarotase
MDITNLDELNNQFAVPHLSFKIGPGGLSVAEIKNRQASARVALLGGHVLSYQPAGQSPLIWLSKASRFQVGQPIRGGIPLIWPWFGPHDTDPTKPAHGFARTRLWRVLGTRIVAEGANQLRLGLADDETTRDLWPHPFRLELVITVGASLSLELIAHNNDSQAVVCGLALHTYFAVSDIDQINVFGLEDKVYVDKVDGQQRKRQAGPLTFSGETDRVYLDTTADCLIDDPGLGRRIRLAKSGSRSTVVWNPGPARSQALPDMAADGYRSMLCVETANALDDVVTIPPGEAHHLQAIISVASRE